MNRVISVLGIVSMLNLCTVTNIPTEIEIVETMPLPPSHQEVIDALKDEIHETPNWDKGCSDSCLQLSQEDAWRLMKLSQAEAGTEGVEGQYLVMCVVINRLNSPEYPDSIAEIIAQPHQFETYARGVYQTTEPSLDSHLALAKLEMNIDNNTDVIAFETTSNGQVLLRWFDMSFTYLNHNFYIKKD